MEDWYNSTGSFGLKEMDLKNTLDSKKESKNKSLFSNIGSFFSELNSNHQSKKASKQARKNNKKKNMSSNSEKNHWWNNLLKRDDSSEENEDDKQEKRKALKEKAGKVVKGAGKVASFGLGLLSSSSNQGVDYGTPEPPKKKLSTSAKVGIGLGITAVVGTTLFLIFRKK